MYFVLIFTLLFSPFVQEARAIESDNPCARLLLALSDRHKKNETTFKIVRAKRALKSFSEGLDSEDIIAYHGTAIESLEFFIKTGHWPGSNVAGYSNSMFTFGIEERTKTDPRLTRLVKGKRGIVFLSEEIALRAASSYAKQVAGGIAFLELLGLPVNTKNYEMAILYIGQMQDDGAVSYFRKKLKFDSRKLDKAKAFAIERKGIVVGIHKHILNHSTVIVKEARGSALDDGLIFDIRNLSVEDIGGIEPLGKYEMQWFEALEKYLE